MGCVNTHEVHSTTAVVPDNVTRFKVTNDTSLSPEQCGIDGVKSGILEVNDEELIHHQKNRQPIRWSYKCLRRYGFGNDTFLFESGRRCHTGPGIFAFKCKRADILNNVFTEKLRQYSINSNNPALVNGIVAVENGRQHRYQEGCIRQRSTMSPAEEPYLVPNSSVNGGSFEYMNQNVRPDHNYLNTDSVLLPSNHANHGSGGCLAVDLGGSHSGRGLNYAQLDLLPDRSVADDHKNGPRNDRNLKLMAGCSNIQYVDINNLDGSSDEDEAFLPNNQSSALQYVNIPPASPTRLPASNTSSAPVVPNKQPQLSGGDNSNIQYTTIDFQKTAAIAQSSKVPSEISSGDVQTRKTRHDSSADNLSS